MSFTYSTLRTAVIAAAAEDGTAFSDFLDTAIALTEDDLSRKLDVEGLTSVAYASVVVSNPFVPKPSNCKIVKSLNAVVSSRRYNLPMRDNEYLAAYWPERTSLGTPAYWSNFGAGAHMLVAPTPSASIEFEIEYVVKPSALTSAAPSNWFSANADSALFAGVMMHSYRFLKHWESAAFWEIAFEKAVGELNEEARRARRDDNSQPENPQKTNNLGARD